MTIVSDDIDILVDALKSLGGGAFLNQTAKNLKQAIVSVIQTNKQASISIKLTIKPDSNGTEEVVIFGNNNITLPKEPIKARFYLNEQMLPVRNAPGQLVFDFNNKG